MQKRSRNGAAKKVTSNATIRRQIDKSLSIRASNAAAKLEEMANASVVLLQPPSSPIGRTTSPGAAAPTNPSEAYNTPQAFENIKRAHVQLIDSYSRYITQIANFEKVSPGDSEFMAAASELSNATCNVIEFRAVFLMQCQRT